MDQLRFPGESVTVHGMKNNPGAPVDRVRLQGKHIQITRYGKPAAMLVPVEWWQLANAAMTAAPADESDEGANDAA